MKKKYINIISLLFLIYWTSILTNYFSFNSIKNKDGKTIIILDFDTEKNIYIKNDIQCNLDNNKAESIISKNIAGSIYLKNKQSFEGLENTGQIECIFNKNYKTIKNMIINFNIFNSKNDSFINISEEINIPQQEIKESQNNHASNFLNNQKNITIKDESSFTYFLNNILNKAKDIHFILIALITFILGILMSLTPCIYPMIPITISILGIDKKNFSQRFYAGILYLLGISLTFSILGILAASGKLFFGQLLSMPIFTAIITIILFLMILQMLGIIESIININNIQMPKFIKDSKYLPFFYGIFSGTITSPCVSPGLIAILSMVGQQTNIFIGWLWLFTFGVGLASPLLLIAMVMNSNFIFPKSGNWMNELKEIIGLLLIFVIKNNLERLFNYETASILSVFIIFLFLFYKYNSFDRTIKPSKYWFCSYSITFAITLIIFFSWNLYEYNTKKNITYNNNVNSIFLENNFKYALEKAIKEEKILFLDFTADWCSICQVVDKELFKNLIFINELHDNYIFCKIDCTNIAEDKEQLIKTYKINGFPSLLIINPQNKEIIKKYSGDILDIKTSILIKTLKEIYKKYYEKE